MTERQTSQIQLKKLNIPSYQRLTETTTEHLILTGIPTGKQR